MHHLTKFIHKPELSSLMITIAKYVRKELILSNILLHL
jgi:hypothetical protein